MKKDRNCVSPYPVYPPYQGMPMMGNMSMPPVMPVPYSAQTTMPSSTNYEQQINNLNEKINSLDKRVTNLEEMVNQNNSINYSNNKYNSTNYPMM